MSCFIVEADNIGAQAEFMAGLLNGGIITQYMRAPESLSDALSTCRTGGRYDAHKIYRRLYIMNLQAYNGRYREDVKTFDKYKPRLMPTNYIRLHKQMSCYLYQCAEDATHDSPLYKAVKATRDALANMIVQSMEEYDTIDGWN